jgi:hypothetical protein
MSDRRSGSDGQHLDGLEPANRFPRFWADYAIDLTVIETGFRYLLLHGNNGLILAVTLTTPQRYSRVGASASRRAQSGWDQGYKATDYAPRECTI